MGERDCARVIGLFDAVVDLPATEQKFFLWREC